ncbi:uncharacterized protein LOC144104506 isoform X1 [Amblyomma americanum]
MRCDTPPRMEDVNDRDSSDDDAPADMDDIEIVEVYEDGASDLSDEEEEEAAGGDLPEEDNDVPLDEAAVSFAAHQGSAFVCAVSGDGQYLVTGGEDDRGCVWLLDSGELVFACSGHTDSVTGAAFNHDSTLVATADMSGSAHVWSMETRQSVCDLDTNTDLNWIDWHRQANVLLAGTADGTVWMWQVPSGQCKTMQGPGVSCGAGRVLADGRRAAAGYDDGSVRVWDLKSSSVNHSLAGPSQTHSAAVTCLDAGGELVATAATDVRLLHAGTGRLLAVLALGAGVSKRRTLSCSPRCSAADSWLRRRRSGRCGHGRGALPGLPAAHPGGGLAVRPVVPLGPGRPGREAKLSAPCGCYAGTLAWTAHGDHGVPGRHRPGVGRTNGPTHGLLEGPPARYPRPGVIAGWTVRGQRVRQRNLHRPPVRVTELRANQTACGSLEAGRAQGAWSGNLLEEALPLTTKKYVFMRSISQLVAQWPLPANM